MNEWIFEYQPTMLINIIILIDRNKAPEDSPFINITYLILIAVLVLHINKKGMQK